MNKGQRRSNKYNVFTSNNSEDGKAKKHKQLNLKNFWKFTKIFAYFLILVFSLTGCVQSFIIKTDNYVGKGFEIYGSGEKITPHMTTLSLGRVEPKNEDGSYTTGNFHDIYFSNLSQPNLIIKNNEKFIGNNKETLYENIFSVLNDQNNGNFNLNDNSHGVIESFHIKVDDNVSSESVLSLESKNTVHSFDGVNSAVISSTAKTYNLNGDTSLSNLKSFKFYYATGEKDNNGIPTFEQYTLNVRDNKNNTWKNVDENELTPVDYYRIAFLNQIFKTDIYNNFLSKNPLDAAITTDAKEKQISQINNFYLTQNIMLSSVLAYTGTNIMRNQEDNIEQHIDKTTKEIFLIHNYYPTTGGKETNYRAVSTWGDAWSYGPFYGLFVFPLGKITALMVESFPFMAGWESLIAIFIIVILTRLFSFVIGFKSMTQQAKMQELQAKKALIDSKYAPYQGNKQMENRKKQEVSALYKKEGISPLDMFKAPLLTMPMFLAVWKLIGGIQHIKSTSWLGIVFSETSYKELFKGAWQYLPLMIVAGGTQLFSQVFPKILGKKRSKGKINVQQKQAMKKNNKTQNIITVVYVVMALAFSAGIQIYWIIGGIWKIFESWITHKTMLKHTNKNKNNNNKKERKKLSLNLVKKNKSLES